MSRILFKNAVLGDRVVDVLIEGNTYKEIAPKIENTFGPDCLEIDATDKAICLPYYNGHAHAPMTLLRGCSDDLELHEWLTEHIWPMEAKLTGEDIYIGSKLAALEMIKSGTVFVNEMYWHEMQSALALDEMGIRACISVCLIDHSADLLETKVQELVDAKKSGKLSDRILLAVGPHSVYTVSRENIVRAFKLAKENDLFFHIHCAETKKEFDDCVAKNGMSPVAYLHSLSVLTPKTILAHCVHVTDEDIEIIKKTGAVVSHQPISNYKLCSGSFRFDKITKAGIRVLVGTDGTSSNNSLDLVTEMRVATLNAKLQSMDPKVCPTKQIHQICTTNGAQVFGIDADEISVGKVADCMLVDLNSTRMIANYDLVSNLVNSADQSCIDTMVCNGKIVMLNRKVTGEAEVIKQAKQVCTRLYEEKRKLDAARK